MKASLNNLKSLSHQFEEWNNVMRDYHELFYGNNDDDNLDECQQVTLKLHNIFETILNFFTQYGEFKDSWDFPARINLFPFSQYATVGSEKMEIGFDFGIDYGNFFLSTHLIYPFNIKSMDDNFWFHFGELASLGQFEFLESFLPSSDAAKKALKKFKNSKSNVFRLIRNYILFELYEGGSADYGWLEIKWPISTSWDIIIKNGASAFKRFYRINYMLFRNEYLRIRMGKRTNAG